MYHKDITALPVGDERSKSLTIQHYCLNGFHMFVVGAWLLWLPAPEISEWIYRRQNKVRDACVNKLISVNIVFNNCKLLWKLGFKKPQFFTPSHRLSFI